ncbi:hypothetical protein [Streptomyces sp. 150FB]|uniref:hypothetical protein n=1 Tax=Streptomyces sp. 150FB TaxID=1576605 RepID=UPI0012371766|nr:hypothetical protein [Streptomyces sp. 150FB]
MFGAALVSLIGTRVDSPELAARIAAGDLSGDDTTAQAAAFTHAPHLALYGTAAVCAVGALAVAAALARPRREATVPDEVAETPERSPEGSASVPS